MQTSHSVAVLFHGALLVCPLLQAQTSSDAAELQQLKSLVISQQKELEQQQGQIRALQSAMAEQNKKLTSLIDRGSGGAKAVTDVDRDPAYVAAGSGARVPVGENPPQNHQQATQSEPPESPPEQQQEAVREELQRGPEIADITPATPALALGPARVRIIGYPAITTLWRSTNNGGNVATFFGNVPFDNTAAGTTSEFRLSPQSTRLALRVDADLNSSYAAGYFEMDFGGVPLAGDVAVTASNYPFRMRQAWFDWGKGNWELTGGQLFSLMTPNKAGILPWPGDVAATHVIDNNFVAGLVWGRYPQLRAVYHFSKQVSLGWSVENPEQQVGDSVVFPTALTSTLSNQYNTGSNQLGVPNMTPDFVFKGSFDGKPRGDRSIHFDVGTVSRVFRSWNGRSVYGKEHAFGWGVGTNFSVELTQGVRFVLQGFAGAGAGRYIGGLAPDVVVRPNGTISPIHSYSWVSGIEVAPNKTTGLYAYYSGVYAQRNSVLNSDGVCCVGFGYPGANTNADRLIEELTAGYSKVLWNFENVGSVQWGVQYAYQWLEPWVIGTGPSSAKQNMVFAQMRYNLP